LEKLIFWGGLLAAYTIWLIVDLINNKGKSIPKITTGDYPFYHSRRVSYIGKVWHSDVELF